MSKQPECIGRCILYDILLMVVVCKKLLPHSAVEAHPLREFKPERKPQM